MVGHATDDPDPYTLLGSILHSISVDYSDRVQIIKAWADGTSDVCVVYRRLLSTPDAVVGRRVHVSPDVDPVRLGDAVAMGMSEPLGSLIESARVSLDGIYWIGIPPGETPPVSPRVV
ncbi:hypothetical protein P0W64_12260 [Tsukamurella sp. 8F]|uniref:hypothetical protein n=1 Tax=unclassified Tsukamurella TaxID=2633480 RepID=UPI0023B9B341|nr:MULTISPECIES: hypothetical protein [unclassified Tsukamurella]MDF0531605.1 hypothetical protein [Tsukamurella sp. 8J]MDF0587548.1 hypothetical protein [Tsukamurella sp. 8F]